MASTIILSDNGASSGSAGLKQTAGNDGVLILQTTTSGGSATNAVYVDTSQNVGLGVTPSAWSGFAALQIQNGALFTDSTSFRSIMNGYYNGSNWIYSTTNAATRYEQLNGIHRWFNAASGTAGNAISFTQAMTLDASGNLQLGTTSGSGRLALDSGSSSLMATFNSTNANGGYLTLVSSGTVYGDIGTAYQAVGGSASDFAINARGVRNLVFGTNNAERARITSGGRFLIGTTTTTYPLYVNLASDTGDFFARFQNTNASSPYGLFMQYSATAPNGSANEFIYCSDSSALRMSVRSNGGIANYTANNSPLSDRRLKKNITPAGSYLEKICAIPVVTYFYNDQTDDLPNLGVIAQDVQAAAPELCNEEGWGTKAEDGTNYLGIWETDIQYALMKCIQELKAELDTAKEQIAILQGAK